MAELKENKEIVRKGMKKNRRSQKNEKRAVAIVNAGCQIDYLE